MLCQVQGLSGRALEVSDNVLEYVQCCPRCFRILIQMFQRSFAVAVPVGFIGFSEPKVCGPHNIY